MLSPSALCKALHRFINFTQRILTLTKQNTNTNNAFTGDTDLNVVVEPVTYDHHSPTNTTQTVCSISAFKKVASPFPDQLISKIDNIVQ